MLKRIYKKIKKMTFPPTEKELRFRKWKSSGSEKLRYIYDLNPNSIVFDLGGYKGEWTSDIFSMYVCKVYVFEPVKKYYEDIRNRFSKNESIKVFPFGLSSKDAELAIGMDDDGSSTFNTKSAVIEIVKLKKASDFFRTNNIQSIDLMKLNIEGGEYDLLEHLIESDLIRNIKNIQVQFHDFVPNAKERMDKIRKGLEKTHNVTYQIEFVWENWQSKK